MAGHQAIEWGELMELRMDRARHRARGARRKARVVELDGGPSQRASEVVVGLAVAARKAGTSEPKDGMYLLGGYAAAQQLFSDPKIGNAPVGLGEPWEDAQAVQKAMIDGGRGRRCDGGEVRFGRRYRGGTSRVVALIQFAPSRLTGDRRDRQRSPDRLARRGRQPALSGLDESVPVGCQLGLSMDQCHPGGVAVGPEARGFAIGEPGQPAQVTPVRTGQVGPIVVGQVLSDGRRQRRFERGLADTDPGLETTGAGLDDDAGLVSVGAHSFNHAGRSQIEVDQDIAGVSVLGKRSDVNVEAIAVAYTQESDHAAATELKASPQSLGRIWFSGLMMNQAKQVQVAGHGGQLPPNGLQGDEESAVHDPGVAWTSGVSRQKRNFLSMNFNFWAVRC